MDKKIKGNVVWPAIEMRKEEEIGLMYSIALMVIVMLVMLSIIYIKYHS